MILQPCTTCRRHIDANESQCPFCRARQPARALATTARTAIGRLSRAAVFAGAAACYTGPATTTTTTTPPPPDPAGSAAAGDATGSGSFAKPPAPPTGHASVRGVVTIDGRPAGNVTVYLRSEKRTISITTSAQGEFEFADLDAGQYTLYSDAPTGRFGPPRQNLTLASDQKLTANIMGTSQPVDRGPCCKPYGAPPARRRVV